MYIANKKFSRDISRFIVELCLGYCVQNSSISSRSEVSSFQVPV